MIKEKLMKALKTAAADYNGGMSANAAVACAAEAWDFNEKQAERLVEMFNTLAALNKEKDASDPTGSCELASKEAVAKILIDGCSKQTQKKASAECGGDYSFYGSDPSKTNPTMEARSSGMASMMKEASVEKERIPDELNVSQRSLYKIIDEKIGQLKTAADAADDVVRNLRLEVERDSIKIAKAIESPFADADAADMFKAACQHENAVKNVAEYSTKVADSDGGRFAKMHVFDASPVEDLLKIAEDIENNISMVSEYEKKRDFYMSKAAEARNEMLEAVGLKGKEESVGLADMFHGIPKEKRAEKSMKADGDSDDIDVNLCTKIAELIRETGVTAEEVARLAEDFDKEAAVATAFTIPVPSMNEAHKALSAHKGVDNERKRVLNVRRSIILADLMTNDPIIRDADPNTVAEAYKTMVMTSPRVSLDKAQVRAFLRSSVNSVAISPADAKIIADVDKGVHVSNVDRLTTMDSSIKDSNQ